MQIVTRFKHALGRLLSTLFVLIICNSAQAHIWQVQAGAYTKIANAKSQQAKVGQILGRPVQIETRDTQSRVLHIVSALGFKDKPQAMDAAEKLRNAGITPMVKPYDKISVATPWLDDPTYPTRLQIAYNDPEWIMKHDLQVPIAPDVYKKTTLELDLRDAILLALRYNPTIQNTEIDRIVTRYGVYISEQDFTWAYALTGNYNYTRNRTGGMTSTGQSASITPRASLKNGIGTNYEVRLDNNYDGNNYNPVASLTVTQPLLRGFGSEVVQRGLKDAYDNDIINQLNLKQTTIASIVTVINDYRNLIQQNNNVITQKLSLKDAEKTYANNQAKIRAGQLEKSANVQQELQIEQIRLGLTAAINSVEQAKQTLLQDMGLDPTIVVTIPSDVDIGEPTLPDLETTIKKALENNLNYQQALIRTRQLKRALVVAKDNLRWQLDLTASTSFGSGGGSGPDSDFPSLLNGRNENYSVGLQLTVPIEDNRLREDVIRAKLELEKQRINLATIKRALVTDVKNQVRNLDSQIQQIKIAKRSLILAERAYELEKKKRLAGITTTLDVSNSQDRVITARNALINSKIAYLRALTGLRQTLGTTLDEWDIIVRY